MFIYNIIHAYIFNRCNNGWRFQWQFFHLTGWESSNNSTNRFLTKPTAWDMTFKSPIMFFLNLGLGGSWEWGHDSELQALFCCNKPSPSASNSPEFCAFSPCFFFRNLQIEMYRLKLRAYERGRQPQDHRHSSSHWQSKVRCPPDRLKSVEHGNNVTNALCISVPLHIYMS